MQALADWLEQCSACRGTIAMLVRRTALFLLLATLSFAAVAQAGVRVIVGATPIPDGEAQAPGDVTVLNEKLAFALAVESAVPYGAARGAIIDVAPVASAAAGARAPVAGGRVVTGEHVPVFTALKIRWSL